MPLPYVGQIAIPYFAQPMTRLRRGPAILVKGHPYDSPFVATSITGAVAVPRGDIQQELPEGVQLDSVIRVSSVSELSTGDDPEGNLPDVLVYNGRNYEVVRAKHIVHAGSYQALAKRLVQEENTFLSYFGVGLADKTTLTGLSQLLQTTSQAAFQVTATGSQKVYYVLPVEAGEPEVEGFANSVRTVTIGDQDYYFVESDVTALGAVTGVVT